VSAASFEIQAANMRLNSGWVFALYEQTHCIGSVTAKNYLWISTGTAPKRLKIKEGLLLSEN